MGYWITVPVHMGITHKFGKVSVAAIRRGSDTKRQDGPAINLETPVAIICEPMSAGCVLETGYFVVQRHSPLGLDPSKGSAAMLWVRGIRQGSLLALVRSKHGDKLGAFQRVMSTYHQNSPIFHLKPAGVAVSPKSCERPDDRMRGLTKS